MKSIEGINPEVIPQPEDNRGKLTITTETSGGSVYISVRDDGIGIKKENLGKLEKQLKDLS